MAGGHPTHGGTNNVPLLDLGQIGSTRHNNTKAHFSGGLIMGPDEADEVERSLPQQNITFRDTLGLRAATHRLVGVLRTKTLQVLNDISNDLNERKTGSRRSNGVLLGANPGLIRETRLTDAAGNIISNRVILLEWRQRDRTKTNSEWAAILQIEILFRVLG